MRGHHGSGRMRFSQRPLASGHATKFLVVGLVLTILGAVPAAHAARHVSRSSLRGSLGSGRALLQQPKQSNDNAALELPGGATRELPIDANSATASQPAIKQAARVDTDRDTASGPAQLDSKAEAKPKRGKHADQKIILQTDSKVGTSQTTVDAGNAKNSTAAQHGSKVSADVNDTEVKLLQNSQLREVVQESSGATAVGKSLAAVGAGAGAGKATGNGTSERAKAGGAKLAGSGTAAEKQKQATLPGAGPSIEAIAAAQAQVRRTVIFQGIKSHSGRFHRLWNIHRLWSRGASGSTPPNFLQHDNALGRSNPGSSSYSRCTLSGPDYRHIASEMLVCSGVAFDAVKERNKNRS